MFDTHAIARALTAADFTPAQADALTDAVRQAAEYDAAGIDVGTLATKDDLRAEVAVLNGAIKALEGAMKADHAALEGAMKTDRAALNGAIKALEGAMKADRTALEGAMKADRTALEGVMKADRTALEGAMKALERATKADLRAEVAALELRLVKWIVGTGVAVAGLVVAGVVAALRLLG